MELSSIHVTCREFVDTLLELVSGELPRGRRRALERHRAGCARCTAYLDGYRSTIEASRGAFAEPGGAGEESLPEDLLRSILAGAAVQPPSPLRRRAPFRPWRRPPPAAMKRPPRRRHRSRYDAR